MVKKSLNTEKEKGKKFRCIFGETVIPILVIILIAIIAITVIVIDWQVGDGTTGDGAGNNDNWIEPPSGTENPTTNPGNTFEPTSKQWVEPPTSSWGGVTSPNAIRV